MRRGICTFLIGGLAVAVIRTQRRLAAAESELEQLRVTAAVTAAEAKPSEDGAGTEDLAYAWEQAVPPMDS